VKQDGDLISKLSEQGYRLTPQRMLVLSAIENSNDHISAEEIYAQVVVKYPYVNISTVYRTLELLNRLGLVTETDLGGGRVRYHPAGKGHHHHLVCQECGKVIDLDETVLYPLKKVLLREYKFSADLRHLAIFGRCADCGK
jgi:Fur family ferric uptake transcriptional regulator